MCVGNSLVEQKKCAQVDRNFAHTHKNLVLLLQADEEMSGSANSCTWFASAQTLNHFMYLIFATKAHVTSLKEMKIKKTTLDAIFLLMKSNFY